MYPWRFRHGDADPLEVDVAKCDEAVAANGGGQATMAVSVVVPVLDDADALRSLLGALRDAPFEVIVVDGGSADASVAVAEQLGATVVSGGASRGLQLDLGFRAARGEWIWMLHADAAPSAANMEEIRGLSAPGWGRFDIRLGADRGLRMVAALMNWRSAWSGICTGDQGIFVHRHLLWAIGGVPPQPLMEDIELSKRLRRLARPLRLNTVLDASPRRWRRRGLWRTIFAMWRLRLRYALGAAPQALYARYYGDSR